MIGILPDKAREVFGIPEGYEAWTGIAIGYEAIPPRCRTTAFHFGLYAPARPIVVGQK
jgi:hypothetical protein